MEMDNIIRTLNEDFMRELEATLIYARNSFIMTDCASSRVTEAIAVDEMRHMWWLADLITKRGGGRSDNQERRKASNGAQRTRLRRR